LNGTANAGAHDRWRASRALTRGFADPSHPFTQQGAGKAYTYKLFLEQAHALLRPGGRLGFIVPSGLYSDHGTGALRRLFLDRCRWEWLFGFENREKVFDIDSRFKFNPVIVEKGGRTEAIRTAFMRRRLEDWEAAERLATRYTRAQVERFSPRSKAILEIQSPRDLEILEKIYANSVLLGDDGPDGWGITYSQGDFNMTTDSKLFPPRPWWEAQGYRPDEYSRWIKGDWRPIEALWRELGVDPSRVVPLDPECERRIAGPDVQPTPWRVRCAQPPYDRLPIPRADIPAGIILSREGDAWVKEGGIEDVALPLYQGVMIQAFDHLAAKWESGTGLNAKWTFCEWPEKHVSPQFLVGVTNLSTDHVAARVRVAFRDIARTTDQRTMIAATLPGFPAGNKVPLLKTSTERSIWLVVVLNSWVFDWLLRNRQAATTINYYILSETALLPPSILTPCDPFAPVATRLAESGISFAPHLSRNARCNDPWRKGWCGTPGERVRVRSIADAISAQRYGLAFSDLFHVLRDCDRPNANLASFTDNAKGFWRVDKDKDPELRHTVLTLVAFADLEEKIRAAGGDRDKGIEAFLAQNDGEGWMLPETLRLADYGLGHDERARHPQPVRSRLGPRFYDWQLAQTAEESWRECEIHAKNLEALSGASPSTSEATAANGPAAAARRKRRSRAHDQAALPELGID
jgi:hypothetical protein